MTSIFQGLIDILIPPKCFICEALSSDPFCESCLRKIDYIDQQKICIKCGRPTVESLDLCRDCRKRYFRFDLARSVGFYQGTLKQAIKALKYDNGLKAGAVLADLAITKLRSFIDCDLIVPVPITLTKQLRRGYNQAEIITTAFSKKLGIESRSVLQIVRPVEDQAGLHLQERKKNVDKAFELKRGADVAGKSVLLVDNVFTSGFTASSIALLLKKSAVKEVRVLTIARAL